MAFKTWGTQRTAAASWRRLRLQVLTRDQGVCAVCHQPGADEVHHVRSKARGGSDDPANLVSVHAKPCHSTLTGKEANAIRWANTPRTGRPPEPHPGIRRPE